MAIKIDMIQYLNTARVYLKLSRKKTVDALILTFYFIFLTAFILIYRPDHIVGHLLIFVLPGLYLIWRYRSMRSHAFLVSIVFGLVAGTLLQIVAELNQLWTYKPGIPFLNFNGLPIEAIAWYVMWSGFAICVHAVFFDRHRRNENREYLNRHSLFLSLAGIVFIVTVLFLLLYPDIFIVKHAYLVFGIPVFVLPALIIFYYRPHVFGEIFRASLFLSIFGLIYEIIGLRVGWWEYPGDFISFVSLGGVSVPVEELILWVAMGTLTVLALYEEIEAE